MSVSAANGRAYRAVSGLGPNRAPRAHAREHIVHVGYHKTASTWLQVSVFPHLADVRYGDPLLAHFLVNLATAADPAFFVAGFRSVLNHSLSRPGLWLLRSWNGLFRLSRFNPDPRLAALPGGRHARNIMLQQVDPILRRMGWKTDGDEEATMLADLASQFARSNERLQQFCAEPLGQWGYVLPAKCSSLTWPSPAAGPRV